MNDNGQAEPLLVAEQVRKVYRTGGIEVEALAGSTWRCGAASWWR